MKRLPLIAIVACLSVSTAYAQSAEPVKQTARDAAPLSEVASSPATDAKDTPETGKAPLSETRCVRSTGSRIRQRDARTACNGLPGRSYSKDDIDRTGHTNLADALRTLDPAFN